MVSLPYLLEKGSSRIRGAIAGRPGRERPG